jgi:hypothetical protein
MSPEGRLDVNFTLVVVLSMNLTVHAENTLVIMCQIFCFAGAWLQPGHDLSTTISVSFREVHELVVEYEKSLMQDDMFEMQSWT